MGQASLGQEDYI